MRRTYINALGQTIVSIDAEDRGPLTEEEHAMIARLDDFEDEYDEDCPPMPEEMYMQMKKDIAAGRMTGRKDNRKRIV